MPETLPAQSPFTVLIHISAASHDASGDRKWERSGCGLSQDLEILSSFAFI